MSSSIRRVGIGIVVLLGLLATQLGYIQLVRSDDLNADPANIRLVLRDFARSRGPIVTSDGTVIAKSKRSNDDYGYQRIYPDGPLYAHITGYQSLRYGLAGIEREYDDTLLGKRFEIGFNDIDAILSDEQSEGTVVLTVDSGAQQAAADALAGNRGSVVVLDVKTGGIVAMYSNPTYDPNLIATHDPAASEAFYNSYRDDAANPMRSRAYRERFPAGSTFKVITTAIALGLGVATPATTYPNLLELELPLTDHKISNFNDAKCGGTLAVSFRDSCNTTFAQIGLDLREAFARGVEDFGINASPPTIDLPEPMVQSLGPIRGSYKTDAPSFAQAAIGQGPVSVTPLQMALVALGVANGGRIWVPHLGHELQDNNGNVVERIAPKLYKTAMSGAAASALRTMMTEVVRSGTGTRAAIPGVQVAGKTGTAQQPGGAPHAWFIGFAPSETPRYAIAVLVERGGDLGDDGTGGKVAAPIAASVFTELFSRSRP